MQESVCHIVREMETDYISGNSHTSKYVDFNMYETLSTIDAYLNSVHISGAKDSLDREKPFFNIVTAARNIWFRATDIDRKNIKATAAKLGQTVEAFLVNMLLQTWMKKSGFGTFLNQWGLTLATYCSAVTKFVVKDGELIPSVIPWNRIICDQINFANNVVIEVLEMTPAQLRKQGYDKDVVESLLECLAPREDLNKQNKDNKADYIKLYEVHGELSLASYKKDKLKIEPEEGDEDTFFQQMRVVSFVGKGKGRGKNKEYEDFILYAGKEKKSPYLKDDLIPEDGRTLGIGPIELLFNAQWMVNHTAKQIKDTLDFASLLILQTSDTAMAGRNALQSLVTGDFLIHAENQPLTQLNNQHDITQIQNFNAYWQNLGKEVTSTPDALRGNTQPAGTAYRLQQLQVNNANSLFDVMTENKGLAIERMMREFVVPFLKTKMDTTEEITALLDSQGISQFDAMYIPNEVTRRDNKQIIDTILSPKYRKAGSPLAQNIDPNVLQQQIQKELAPLGSQRFVKPSEINNKTWKEVLKDFEWEVTVDPTQESEDIQDSLATLQSTFQTIASLAGRPMSADEKFVFNQIMEKAGTISPLQLNQTPTLQPQMPVTGGSPSAPLQTNQPAMAQQ